MKHFLTALFLAVVVAGCASKQPSSATVANAPDGTVIDVRTPEEYATGHVRGSTNVPLSELPTRIAQVMPDKTAPVMVHCQAGGRSARAKAALDKMGYTNVKDLGSLANARAEIEGK